MRSLILSVACGLAAMVAVADSGDVALAKSSRSEHHFASHRSGHMRDFHHRGHHYRFHSYGRDYRGWSSYCWFPKYRSYGYYCPTRTCWYYWSASYSYYMPCSYMPTFPPTPVNVNANVNTDTNVNVNRNTNNNVIIVGGPGGSVPTLPPGAAVVPTGAAVPLMPGAAQ